MEWKKGRRGWPLALLLASCIAVCPTPARAFGAAWHEAVGSIADRNLTPQARAWVSALLSDEPTPTLEATAAWADTVKDTRTRRWHFIDLADDCVYRRERDCPDGQCLIEALDANLGIVRDAGAPVPERGRALKFVVHLMGDLAQPFHNYGAADGRGGNKIQLRFRDRGTNLHALWDSVMLRDRWTSPEQLVDALQARPRRELPVAAASMGEIVRWSQSACRSAVQASIERSGTRVDDSYASRALAIEEEGIWAAGRRLAATLNAIASGANNRDQQRGKKVR
ncbi:MAG TPA: S1/P1 nuclease [Rhodanobacteraceae bacterium]|nr:S1/P1 nuclease [Rhodanobacteraceae bacterium]